MWRLAKLKLKAAKGTVRVGRSIGLQERSRVPRLLLIKFVLLCTQYRTTEMSVIPQHLTKHNQNSLSSRYVSILHILASKPCTR